MIRQIQEANSITGELIREKVELYRRSFDQAGFISEIFWTFPQRYRDFPDGKNIENTNKAYKNFIQKIAAIVNSLVSITTKIIKSNL